MPDEVRVVIVDDHELLAESLVRMLDRDPDISVVGMAITALGGIDTVMHEHPDVVLMDFSLPDMNGADATRLLRAALPDVKVIMLTGAEQPGSYTAAIEAGCVGWVRKTRAVDELMNSIRRVAAGERIGIDEYEDVPPLQEIVVYYQPVVGLSDRRLVGFEALVRWNHPEQGLRLPGTFLRLAEATGYVNDIGRQVMVEVLHDIAAWDSMSPERARLWVSVNISAVGLSSQNVVKQITDLFATTTVDPNRIVIEITETALLEDSATIAKNLRELKEIGLKLALDDFGTAFSSLEYLRRYPFDHIKIDATFTAELPGSERAVLLVESIIDLASRMGATCIAEGIERLDQAECLIEAGWHLAQGFLYGKAVPFDEASEIIRRGTV